MISIVIPVHDEAAFLPSTVEQILRDLGSWKTPFELVLVENGSTDGTGHRAASLAQASTGKIKVKALPAADYGAAARAGLLECSGEVAAVVDLDSWDAPWTKAAAELVSGGADFVVGAPSPDRRGFWRRLAAGFFRRGLAAEFPDLKDADPHAPIVMRTEKLWQAILATASGGDFFKAELMVRALQRGARIRVLPAPAWEVRSSRRPLLARVRAWKPGLRALRSRVAGG